MLPGIILLGSSNVALDKEDGPAPSPLFPPDPPLGLYRIKKWLEDRGLARILIVDPNLDGGIASGVERFAKEGPVMIVGVSLTRYYLEHDLINIGVVRDWVVRSGRPAPISLAGGYECTLGSAMVLSLGHVEGVIQGFGEFPLGAMLRYTSEHPDAGPDALRGCRYPSVLWREDIAPGPELTDAVPCDPQALYSADAQPLDNIDWSRYWARIADLEGLEELPQRRKATHLVTSSHCLAPCAFCSSRRYGSQVLKDYDLPPAVLMMPAREIERLALHAFEGLAAGGVYFIDDDFVVGGKHGMARFDAFCQEMEAHYESGRLSRSFWLGMQTKTRHFHAGPGFSPFAGGGLPSLEQLTRSGFYVLEFGVEAFSDELLRSPFINKKTSAAVNAEVILNCLKAGIKTSIFYIPFPPTVTPESYAESLSKLAELLEQGAHLGISPWVRIFAGSEVADMVDDPRWTYRSKLVRRADGSTVDLPDVYLPSDERVARVLEEAVSRNRGALKSARRRQKPGFQLLADVAELLGYPELAGKMERLGAAD